MDNSEEYVLQVFRRAQMMLEETLTGDQADRLRNLGDKLEQTADLHAEARCLKYIEGFSKAGIAFDWLLARSKRDAEFNLDQFDADVRVLYDVLHEGMSDRTQPSAVGAHPAAPGALQSASALPEPDWNSVGAPSAYASVAEVEDPEMPSFSDLLDPPMLLTVHRLADSAALFGHKPEPERATALAMLKMMAKSIVDMARPQNKIIVMSAFQEIAGLMESIERRGSAREEDTEHTVTELGRTISAALADPTGGMRHMTGIIGFINDHKASNSK